MHTSSEEKKSRDLTSSSNLKSEVRDCKMKILLYLDQLDRRGLPTVIKEFKKSCSILPRILENYELALDEYLNFVSRDQPENNRFLQAYSQMLSNMKNTWIPEQLENFNLFFSNFRATEAFSLAKNFSTYFKLALDSLRKLTNDIVPLMKQISEKEDRKISSEAFEIGQILWGFIKETKYLLKLRSEIYLQQEICFEHDYLDDIEAQSNRIKLADQHQQDLITYFSSSEGFELIPWCKFLRTEPLGAWCSVFFKEKQPLTLLLRDKILNPFYLLSNDPAKLNELDERYKVDLRLLKSRNINSDTHDIIVHLYHFFTTHKLSVVFSHDRLVNVCEQIRRLREDAKSVSMKNMFAKIKRKPNVIQGKSQYENLSENQIDLFLYDALQFILGPEFILKSDELVFLKNHFQTSSDVDPEQRDNFTKYISESTWCCNLIIRHHQLISNTCISLFRLYRLDEPDRNDIHVFERVKSLQFVLLLTLEHLKSGLSSQPLDPERLMVLRDLHENLVDILKLLENDKLQSRNNI